jgi:membrane-associated phospholipid phosphatase
MGHLHGTVTDSQTMDNPGQCRPPSGSDRFHPVLAVCGVTLLALAGAFAAYVSSHPGPLAVTADRAWLSLLQHARVPVLTSIVKVVTKVLGPAGGTVVVAIVAVYLWFARHRRIGAVFLAAALAVTSGASVLIKHLVMRPRPPGQLVPADIGSFPSGNVITTLAVGTALVLVLARPRHRGLPLACVVIATLVSAWCRTYLGEHWLSDTLESVLVAAGAVLTGWAFAGRYVDAEAARGKDLPGRRDKKDKGGAPDASGVRAGGPS